MATGQLLIGVERVNALAVSIVLCALGTMGAGILFGRWVGLSGIAMAMAIAKLTTIWPIQLWAMRRLFAGVKGPPVEAASEAPA
jgi:hypothetical protein